MNHGGTGLGLSICKSLIELMGGSVRVESEKDVGTNFIMSLKTKCNITTNEKAKKIMRKLNGDDANQDQIMEGDENSSFQNNP